MAILQVNGRPAVFDSKDTDDKDCRPRESIHSSTQHPPTRYITTNPGDRALYQPEIQSFTDPFDAPARPEQEANRPARHKPTSRNSPAGGANGSGADGRAGAEPRINWILTPGTTVGRALVSATQRLSEARCDNARLDSQVLLAHVLDKDRTWLFAHHDYELSPEDCERYTELVARRIRREPVAYLLGRKEFYGLDFVVDPRVLIPRPETELLVDLALAQIQDRTGRQVVVADVGTGSGAIAVTLAFHAPQAKIYGVDISRDALAVAQKNSRRLAPGHGPILLEGDMLHPLPEAADLIVANLPYISDEEYCGLQPDVRRYEPRLALQAGSEGLDSIERLLAQVPGKLNPGGAVLLEIGSTQGEAVAEMAKALRPKPAYVGVRRDYSGLVRMVTIEF